MGDNNVHPEEDDSDGEADMFCPALPPHLLKKSSPDVAKRSLIIGPSLPPAYKPPGEDESVREAVRESESEDDDADLVGPLPPSAGQDERFNVPEMEYRMEKLIKEASKKDDKPERETWMLELPSDKPNILALGLGPRQFRKKTPQGMGDRSGWTDTPEDKERKARLGKEKEAPVVEEDPTPEEVAAKRKDEELAGLVEDFREKKRSVPLIDLHRTKKAKTEEGRPRERKPFSREDDLNVNKFDAAQKEAILKKARNLNERFSAGNRKFL